MSNTAEKKVTAFGEIVWDVFKDVKVLGGAPLNFAYFCGKLGAEAGIISAVGDDTEGDEAIARASREGIDIKGVHRSFFAPTGRVDVVSDAQGKPAFKILSPAAWDFIYSDFAALEAARSCDAFAFGTLAQRASRSRTTLEALLEELPQDCLAVFDVNLRGHYYSASCIENSLRRADIFKLSDDELPVLAEMFGLSGDAAQICAALVKTQALRYLLLTKGARGYEVFGKQGLHISGACPDIKVVDTVGAGDSFCAAFTMKILNAETPQAAAEFANNFAGEVCARKGAFCL